MTPEEITRLQEIKAAIHSCPDGCAVRVLGIPMLEEFLTLTIKEKEND